MELAVTHIEDQCSLYQRANAAPDQAWTKAAENLVHMLLSSNEFLYVD